MTDPIIRNAQKRSAARAAVAEVEPGMLVGLGTGSTAAFAIEALGERVATGLSIRAIATSRATEKAAAAAGIALLAFDDIATVDLCIDGVDEIDLQLRAIKGAGGAMLREKIVAQAATRMIAVADASKLVARLGAASVPVEVLPFARSAVARAIGDLDGVATLRERARTDQDNIVLDCRFPSIGAPAELASALSAIAGVLGHGLFPSEINVLYVGAGAGTAAEVQCFARPDQGITQPVAGDASLAALCR